MNDSASVERLDAKARVAGKARALAKSRNAANELLNVCLQGLALKTGLCVAPS